MAGAASWSRTAASHRREKHVMQQAVEFGFIVFPRPPHREKVVCGVWKTYRQKAPNNSGLSSSQCASPTAQGPCGLLRPSDPSCPVWSRWLLPFEPSGRSLARGQDGGGERDARVPQRHSGSSRATLVVTTAAGPSRGHALAAQLQWVWEIWS